MHSQETKELSLAYYLDGSALKEAADLVGVTEGAVQKWAKKAGVTRSKTVALTGIVKTNNPTESGVRKRTKGIWERVCGKVPNGHVIHHIDHDPFNNDLSNLECMDAFEHNSLHHRGEYYGTPPEDRPGFNEANARRQREYRARQKAKYAYNEKVFGDILTEE